MLEKPNQRRAKSPTNARSLASVEWLPFVQSREIILPSWAAPDDRFILCPIRGDTLLEAGLRDGDHILVLITDNVLADDLVAIRTPLGILVKYLSFSLSGDIVLRGSNGPSRTFQPNQVHIEGRFVRREF